MYIQGKYIYAGDSEMKQVFEIRKKVFQEEQGVPYELERDDKDAFAVHAAAYEIGSTDREETKKIVAVGRIIFDGDSYKIGRIAVLKEERGKDYGDFVVKMLIQKAFLNGGKEVYVDSQEHAVGFYKKIGFVECGEPFIEIGKKHVPMKISTDGVCTKCSHGKL